MTTRDVTTGKLPPGQVVTARFPPVGEREPSPDALDLGAWRLVVDGLVAQPLEMTHGEVMAIAQDDLIADIHCVTGWTQYAMRFTGCPLARILEMARPSDSARFARFAAYSSRGHDTSLPLDLALRDTWLVHAFDGEPLTVRHGWPLRTVTPSRYFYKSLKWVQRIELIAVDVPGYWERESAYHNVGDPWPGDQRFATGSIDPKDMTTLRIGTSLAKWRRGKLVLAADLRGWDPVDRDLRGVVIKNCDLRDAHLAGADLRGANLSLTDFRNADLAGADLRTADVEGANFAGADLTGAALSGAALSATRFFEENEDGSVTAARIEGMTWDGATGLIESQEAFLRGE